MFDETLSEVRQKLAAIVHDMGMELESLIDDDYNSETEQFIAIKTILEGVIRLC